MKVLIRTHTLLVIVKICFSEQRFAHQKTTGPSRHIRELSAALVDSGHEVVVICETPREDGLHSALLTDCEAGRIRVILVKGVGIGNQRFPLTLAKQITREKPDIIHVQGYRSFFTDISVAAAKINRIPVVMTPRGSLLGYMRRKVDSMVPIAAQLYDLLTLKAVLRFSDTVVVTTKGEMEDALRMGVRIDRIRLIPHGMTFPRIPEKMKLGGNPKLLTVSRITPHRNIATVVASMREIAKEFPDAMLYVIGDPISFSSDAAERAYPDVVRRLAERNGIAGHVRLVGGVYGENLWNYLASCDLFVYASSYDNFGFGLLEAAHFGLPIISTNVGIASELIAGDRGGEILLTCNEHEIAEACSRILGNPRRMAEMRNHLREIALGYSIERNCDAHSELYKVLLHDRRSPND